MLITLVAGSVKHAALIAGKAQMEIHSKEENPGQRQGKPGTESQSCASYVGE